MKTIIQKSSHPLVALTLAASLSSAQAVISMSTFTDPVDVGVTPPSTGSGWDMVGLVTTYDSVTDILNVTQWSALGPNPAAFRFEAYAGSFADGSIGEDTNFTGTTVPEPSSVLLGLCGMAFMLRRKRK